MADDEVHIRDVLRGYLEAEGFEVVQAADGNEALRVVREHHPDLVLLDVTMPGLDGVEVLRQLRTESDVYVIMLTARTEEVDKLVGLAVGADDYITKPFSPRELVARVKAVLRRGRGTAATTPDEQLVFKGLTIDLPRRALTRDGVPVELSALEFDLLVALARAPAVCSRAVNCSNRSGVGTSSATNGWSTSTFVAFDEHSGIRPTRHSSWEPSVGWATDFSA